MSQDTHSEEIDPRSEAAKTLGAIGGARGTGKSKKRSKAHYRRMVAIRKKNLKLKKENP